MADELELKAEDNERVGFERVEISPELFLE